MKTVDQPLLNFNGPAYQAEYDRARLTTQNGKILTLMSDGQWRTLGEIEEALGFPQSSISAQLRHMRKPLFGSHQVNRRHRGLRGNGLYEYQLITNNFSS